MSSNKQILKNNIISICNNYNSYDLISLYRNLIKYNNRLRIYILDDDVYNSYMHELYNMIDEYAYSDENNHEELKKEFITVVNKIIDYL
jgi:hypothetical protein